MTITTATANASAGSADPPSYPRVRRPSLGRLTGVELRKLVDTRAGRWLLITIGLVVALLATTQVIWMPDAEQTFDQFFMASLLPVSLLLPVLGILSITSEWSQRSALTTFALVPKRERVIVAKLGAVLVAALASVLASLVIATLATVSAGMTGGAGSWKIEAALLPHAVLVQVISVLMGSAFGLLLLNTPLAIVSYLLLPTVWTILGTTIEPLRGPSRWLDTSLTMEPLFTTSVTGEQWARLAVSLLVWLALPLVVGVLRTLRREVA